VSLTTPIGSENVRLATPIDSENVRLATPIDSETSYIYRRRLATPIEETNYTDRSCQGSS